MLENKEFSTFSWNRSAKEWESTWGPAIRGIAEEAMALADPGHGIDHVMRVVVNASVIGQHESLGSNAPTPEVVLPAAWLHDCVLIAKNSPERSRASRLAADRAIELLQGIAYPAIYFDKIHHAILAHSFSANVPCESIDAKVVQDADRLEALGAIGIARCLMTGGHLQVALYDVEEPFPSIREPDDRRNSVDHFFCKLFRLPATMNTDSGKSLAGRRTIIMREFLRSLCDEIGCDQDSLTKSFDKISG